MLKSRPHCKLHKEAQLIEDKNDGDLVCPKCGLVVCSRVIDLCSEWRSFADDDVDKSRVGMEESDLFNGISEGTIIDSNQQFAGENGTLFRNRHTKTSVQRISESCRSNIQTICENLRASRSIGRYANDLIKEIIMNEKKRKDESDKKEKMKIGNHKALAAFCVSETFRHQRNPRSMEEISRAAGISKRDLNRMMKKYKNYSGQNVKNSDFVGLYVSKVMGQSNETSMKVENLAKVIADRATDHKVFGGRSPLTVVSTSIYMALMVIGLTVDKSRIAAACNSSETTFIAMYRELYEFRHNIIPEEIFPQYKQAVADLPRC